MMQVQLGTVNGSPIITETRAGDLTKLVQVTLGSHSYVRAPMPNAGYPPIGVGNGVPVPTQVYSGTIANGTTIWCYNDEAQALISGGFATATGETMGSFNG
jgi:hypothetical protein